MIAYYASDLLWATRIKGMAGDLGIPARPVRTLQMLEDRLADSDVRGLVVDLAGEDRELALSFIHRAQEESGRRQQTGGPGIGVAAFGPHVEVALLDAAAAAGARVYTRGAFSERMDGILRSLEGGG
jgi:hypothetical protein